MSATGERSWTGRVRDRAVAALPPEKLLPDEQPSYVASWIYVFGVLSLASLAVLIGSGTILHAEGPSVVAFHRVGHFFNSLHLWSVELFFSLWSSTCGRRSLDGGVAGRARAW